MATPSRSYKLMTVNKNAERAARLFPLMMQQLNIASGKVEYCGNVTAVEDVRALTQERQPDILISASTWTTEEAEEISHQARLGFPSVKRVVAPFGLADQSGGNAVTLYVASQVADMIAELRAES